MSLSFSFILVSFSANNQLSKAASINGLLFTVYYISSCLWILKLLCQFPDLNYFTPDVKHIVNYKQYFLSLGEMLLCEEMSNSGEWNDTAALGICRYLVY